MTATFVFLFQKFILCIECQFQPLFMSSQLQLYWTRTNEHVAQDTFYMTHNSNTIFLFDTYNTRHYRLKVC